MLVRTASTAILALLLASAPGVQAQTPHEDLAQVVAQLDSMMFAAFNNRDVETQLSFISEDLEFFHDVDGLSGYQDFIDSSHRLFAQDNGLKRDPVAGSFKVYAVPGYGAIQIGQHRFCHWENGAEVCGVFGFTHEWQRTEDRWQITRVLSYGH